jgi:phosphatidylglycerol:prolipoprotein diacylglycerol transferase
MAAVGVLAALFLAQRTARMAGVDAARLWNLCVLSLCAALVAGRLLLVAVNWSAIRLHPQWTLGLGMVHHPLVAGIGALAAAGSAALYIRLRGMRALAAADALAAPIALGLACEQVGALLAGAGYGTDAAVPWAVTYRSPVAALWSGTPLGIPLHPVQAYAALAFLTLAILLLVWLPARRREGDVAGVCLMGMGAAIYLTELWRDPEGRGAILNGALDGPQIAAIAMVVAGALILRERNIRSRPPLRQEEVARMGHGEESESASQQVSKSAFEEVVSHPFHDGIKKQILRLRSASLRRMGHGDYQLRAGPGAAHE